MFSILVKFLHLIIDLERKVNSGFVKQSINGKRKMEGGFQRGLIGASAGRGEAGVVQGPRGALEGGGQRQRAASPATPAPTLLALEENRRGEKEKASWLGGGCLGGPGIGVQVDRRTGGVRIRDLMSGGQELLGGSCALHFWVAGLDAGQLCPASRQAR